MIVKRTNGAIRKRQKSTLMLMKVTFNRESLEENKYNWYKRGLLQVKSKLNKEQRQKMQKMGTTHRKGKLETVGSKRQECYAGRGGRGEACCLTLEKQLLLLTPVKPGFFGLPLPENNVTVVLGQ